VRSPYHSGPHILVGKRASFPGWAEGAHLGVDLIVARVPGVRAFPRTINSRRDLSSAQSLLILVRCK
jgi:hypothetical protein